MLYSKALRLAGFATKRLKMEKKLIRKFEDFQTDLIILDLVMPEQEGIETFTPITGKISDDIRARRLGRPRSE